MTSAEKEEVRKAIISMVQGLIPLNTTWCKVKSVSGQNCTVEFDELEISEILLGFDKSGVIVYPKVNSNVLVAFVNNSRTVGAVIMVDETDKVEILGNVHGGLVKIDNLKIQYDTNLVAIKAAISAGLAPVDAIMAMLGMPAPTSTQLFNSAWNSVQDLNKTPLENTKVKHGEG